MQVFGDGLLISRTATLVFVTKFALVGRHLQQNTVLLQFMDSFAVMGLFVYCKIISESVGISIGTAETIVVVLGYLKACTGWVPRQLTDEPKLNRFNIDSGNTDGTGACTPQDLCWEIMVKIQWNFAVCTLIYSLFIAQIVRLLRLAVIF